MPRISHPNTTAIKAGRQAEEFDRAFKDKGFPEDIVLTEIAIGSSAASIIAVLADHAKILASRGEAKRKVQEGAVEVDGGRVVNIDFELKAGREYQVRVGKKFARIFLKQT